MPPILPLELETPLITSVTPDSKKADEQKRNYQFKKIKSILVHLVNKQSIGQIYSLTSMRL